MFRTFLVKDLKNDVDVSITKHNLNFSLSKAHWTKGSIWSREIFALRSDIFVENL